MIKYFTAFFFSFIVITASAQVKLPRLFSDSMILQRDAKIKIWGWASAGEKVAVHFINKTYNATTSQDGKWMITVSPIHAGGPFDMTIDASNHITVKNILIGDVWVCSGQSNMELMMERVKYKYADEVATANNAAIRQFTIPDTYDFIQPHNDVNNGKWIAVTPSNIFQFSAVAYFFAKEIYARYKIPIGLINSALGGSPAEAWMSEDALKSFPDYYNELQKFKDTSLIKEIESKDKAVADAWYQQLNEKDEGLKQNWKNISTNDNDWNQMNVPGYWSNVDSSVTNGSVWFRKKFSVPAGIINKPVKLELGRIVDADSVFINGQYVGNTTYQYPPRIYWLTNNVLKAGENVIAVRVISNSGKGGFVLDKPYRLTTSTDTIDLKGLWKYKLGATMLPLPAQTFIRWKPGGLYNAMIAPLLNYNIKGVIWYQGESNANSLTQAKEYEKLFPALIQDWRNHWQQNFSFLYVQLPNFMEAKEQPSESAWAELREAQLKTLSVANTAMAVAIDIGEWNDIHPLDKKDVGKRLALAAEKIAYDENIVYSGPIYHSMKIEGNKIILSFTNVGSGLIAKNGTLKYFSIAGDDKKFVWANATIQNNKVIVWSDAVQHPVAVRYAWADNPEGANLYNKESLPASPFATDK